MARRVPGRPAGEVRTFIPEAYGNREDPEPVEIELMQPTEAQRRNLFRMSVRVRDGRTERNADGSVRVTMEAEDVSAYQKKALEGFVSAVRNYESADGKPIVDGAGLWEHGEDAIVGEVVGEILGRAQGLATEEKKASEKPIDSSAAETPRSDGTAESVAPAERMSIADAA